MDTGLPLSHAMVRLAVNGMGATPPRAKPTETKAPLSTLKIAAELQLAMSKRSRLLTLA